MFNVNSAEHVWGFPPIDLALGGSDISQCNFGIPCNACTKRAGNLAHELCTRQGLVAARFNNIGM